MKIISASAMPCMIFIIIVAGYIQNVPVYETFIKGAKNGLIASKNIIIPLIGLMTAVYMMRTAGLTELVCNFLKPMTDKMGFPSSVLPAVLLKPISGSASLAVLEDILKTQGPDSFPGRVASVLSGSAETIFYTLTVYCSAGNIKKTRYIVPVALLANLVCVIVSSVTVTYFFGK